ncbi:MAG: TonB-dependent receptor [Gemmatimonadales bacterium]|nr:TonB-dependent receptor [Gemmatimonadales bacterium]
MRYLCLFALTLGAAAPAAAQSSGGLVGKVVDAATGTPLRGAEIRIDAGARAAITDTAGEYRIRGLTAGPHTVTVAFVGYRPSRREGVIVRVGEITRADVRMAPVAVELATLTAVGVQDPVLDPLAPSTVQRISAEDLRRLPVSSLEDALGLQAGVVGESYRGGRIGQQAFILDGLGVKNQLDASTGGSGLRIPPDLIADASLITNGFSARYGQAISGLVSVSTRDGGDRWRGRMAYETDRPMSGRSDLGLDRVVFQADGPIAGRITAVGILDFSARLDAEPVSAPAPSDPRDPRSTAPSPLPHNSGEVMTAGGKLTIPMGTRVITRLFGLGTREQRYLYDQRYKYDAELGPGRRVDGTLASAHVQLLPSANSRRPISGDLRLGYFSRDFVRGAVTSPDYKFGAFTGSKLEVQGEELARRQDTLAARQALPGFDTPTFSDRTPYGVPAFFLGNATQGELAFNTFSELRSQLDFTAMLSDKVDLGFGGLHAAQDVKTFQRVFAYRPVGGIVPPATASAFSPSISALYAESQVRLSDIAVTAGVRYDAFSPGGSLDNRTLQARSSVNPRIAVSTVLSGATIVASIGKFSQPPDLQFLVDAAFDDTTRTGRFRQGNPDLGFEQSTQFELSARVRLREAVSLRVNVFNKRLEGLVSSAPINVNPDSSVFVNADIGNVSGAEVILERERRNGWGMRMAAVLQRAEATVTDAFQLLRLTEVDIVNGDTVRAARSQWPLDYDRRLAFTATVDGELPASSGPRILGIRPFERLTGAAVLRYGSGLPYTRTNITGDSLVGEINGSRLPSQFTVDLLLRRPVRFGGFAGGVYLDVRNVLNRANQLAVRRESGTPNANDATIAKLAETAYLANPQAIPYESPRYRRAADTNNDGVVSGRAELYPLYEAAARDFTQPLFVYGAPRLIRFGMEVLF